MGVEQKMNGYTQAVNTVNRANTRIMNSFSGVSGSMIALFGIIVLYIVIGALLITYLGWIGGAITIIIPIVIAIMASN